MKMSENWLRTWIDPKISRDELAACLTMAGLEVESITPVSAPFTGVVVGEVIQCEPHPNADKLRVTHVKYAPHQAAVQVICGAPNVRVGLKVPLATVGAVLPKGIKIKKAKLRNITSFGMLCSASELGLNDLDNAGIMALSQSAVVGQNIRAHLDLDDAIFDIGLTPNRSDCLSILGLARELRAHCHADFMPIDCPPVAKDVDDILPIHIDAPAACPKFSGRVINNVNIQAETPLWMKRRLIRSGVRPLDPIVDITNYVMLELGQPMHGYDLEKIEKGICVRYARKNESLTLLNGTCHTLTDDTLLITDHKGPLGLAGIMGSAASGIHQETKHIFLESAFFSPQCLAGKARSFGLRTEASHRFERGVDVMMQEKAIERATALIVSICGGHPGPMTTFVDAALLPKTFNVSLRHNKVNMLLGQCIERDTIESILKNLAFPYRLVPPHTWHVHIPSWRFDITIEEDLIEEIGRIWGYHRLPECRNVRYSGGYQWPQNTLNITTIKHHLVGRGYHEVITFSLIDAHGQQHCDPHTAPVVLQNSISSEMAVMRTSLLPGLLKSAAYNQKRQHHQIRLFETGQIFIQEHNKNIVQKNRLAALMSGTCLPDHWASSSPSTCNFFDLKGDVEALLKRTRHTYSFRSAQHSALHPGQTAHIFKQDKCVGYIGAVHPNVLQHFNLSGNIYIFEIDAKALLEHTPPAFQSLSKFPEVRRDIAIIVNHTVTCSEITDIIKENSGQWLRDVRLFDVYTGAHIGESKKSLAFALTWRHATRTLEDDEIHDIIVGLVTRLEQKVEAKLRK